MSTHLRRYWTVRELVKDGSLKIKDIAQQTGYDKGHVSRLRKESQRKKVIADAVAAEREKLAAWMMAQGYATGHGDTVEDLLKELEWQIAENWTNALVKGVEGEREACAKACEEMDWCYDDKEDFAAAIRARGQA